MGLQAKNMGKFARLPREVRDQIWIDSRSNLQERHQNDLAILRACKQTSREFTEMLHKGVILIIKLQATYQRQSWFTVEHPFLGTCHVGYLQTHGLASLPWKLISEVKIENDAPRPKVSGELICLLYKIRDLVDILNDVQQLPKTTIHLLDTPRAKWWFKEMSRHFTGVVSEIVRAEARTDGRGELKYHFVTVLHPFMLSKSITLKELHVPKEVEQIMKASIDTASALTKDDIRKKYQRSADNIFYELDCLLDSESGHTAGMMRLHRFSTWYENRLGGHSKYMAEQQRIHREGTVKYFDIERLRKRFHFMQAMNPLYPDGWDLKAWHEHYVIGIAKIWSLKVLQDLVAEGQWESHLEKTLGRLSAEEKAQFMLQFQHGHESPPNLDVVVIQREGRRTLTWTPLPSPAAN